MVLACLLVYLVLSGRSLLRARWGMIKSSKPDLVGMLGPGWRFASSGQPCGGTWGVAGGFVDLRGAPAGLVAGMLGVVHRDFVLL